MYSAKLYVTLLLALAEFYCAVVGQYSVAGHIGKVIEGEVVTVKCISEVKTGVAPTPQIFSVASFTPLVISPGHMTKNIVADGNLKKTLTLTYNPIKLSDQLPQGYACGSMRASSTFHIYILPKVSIPKIDLEKNAGKETVGSEMKLSCNALMGSGGLGKKISLNLKWLYSGNRTDITSIAKTTYVKDGGTRKVDSTLTRKIDKDSFGSYQCLISVTLTTDSNSATYLYMRNATVDLAVSVESGVKVRQEVKIYKGKSVELICKITGYPAATVTWMKKDKPITASTDKRYNFSNYESSKNGRFRINSVDYSDRGVYTCNASSTASFATMQMTLRVRDPLGALWPFIGIVIEAIILAIIIIAYEKYRCKKGEKCGRKGKKEGKEISPLLPKDSEPGIEYTSGTKGGEDGVKMRNIDVQA